MKDSLLTYTDKKKIPGYIEKKNYDRIISILEGIKSGHAGTAKMKDKVFVVKEIVNYIFSNSKNPEKSFYTTGKYFCKKNERVSKEIGVSIIWRAYGYDRENVERYLLEIADNNSWEVREFAGGAFSNTLMNNPSFESTLKKWRAHASENIRRAVVMSAISYSLPGEKKSAVKAFSLIEPLLYDSSRYVKKNLGPFVIGSYFGGRMPDDTFKQIKKWSRIKDEHVRWNTAMAFNNHYGHKHPDKALEILSYLSKDENRTVRRAVISSLRHINKRHKSKVSAFLKAHNLKI